MINKSNVAKVLRDGKPFYRARLVFPYDPELGRKPSPKDFYARTEREAIAKRDAWKPENPLLDSETALVAFLETEFDDTQEALHNSGELSWQRLYNRRSRLKRFIIEPALPVLQAAKIRGAVLGKLTPALLEEFFKLLTLAGVSPANRNGLYFDLRLALKLAKRRVPNPLHEYFEDIKLAKERRKPKRLFHEADVFSALADESKPIEARLLVAFIFFTQCRPSEMFALHWKDVDLKLCKVRFDKAVRRTESGYAVSDGTKTGEKGDRTIALGSILTALLRELKKQRMKDGITDDTVFLWRSKPLNKDRSRYAWEESRTTLGLPEGPTLYSLKTLGNSFAARKGVSAEVRAARMGHTTTRMATQTYRDIAEAGIVQSAEVFDVAVRSRMNRAV